MHLVLCKFAAENYEIIFSLEYRVSRKFKMLNLATICGSETRLQDLFHIFGTLFHKKCNCSIKIGTVPLCVGLLGYCRILIKATAFKRVVELGQLSVQLRLLFFKGAGGLYLVDHGNWFYGVFWQTTSISISCFLPHQKILMLTKLIAGRSLAPKCNSIACANLSRDFPKMAIFRIWISNWAQCFHGIILKLDRH